MKLIQMPQILFLIPVIILMLYFEYTHFNYLSRTVKVSAIAIYDLVSNMVTCIIFVNPSEIDRVPWSST